MTTTGSTRTDTERASTHRSSSNDWLARPNSLGVLDRVLYAGLCVTAFLVPLEGAVLLGSATITIYIGTITTMAFIGSLVFERRLIHRSGRAGRSLFLRIGLATLGLVLWTEDLPGTQRQLPFLFRLSLLAIMMFQVGAGSPTRWRGLCRSLGYGAAFAAGVIVYNWAIGETFVEAGGHVQRTIAEAGVGAARRYTVGTVDPNYMALVLGVGMLMLLAGVAEKRRMAYACVPLLALGIALTGSRTALVAVFAAGLYYFTRSAFKGHKRARLFAGALVAVGLVAFSWQFVPDDTQVRAKTVLDAQDDNSANQRRDAWAAGLKAWNKVPILGSGLATFQTFTIPYTPGDPTAAHSLYINQLVEGGLLGVAISMYGLSSVWRSTGGSRVRPERLALIIWATTGIALDLDLNKLTFVLLPLCLLSGLHRRDAEPDGGLPVEALRARELGN